MKLNGYLHGDMLSEPHHNVIIIILDVGVIFLKIFGLF